MVTFKEAGMFALVTTLFLSPVPAQSPAEPAAPPVVEVKCDDGSLLVVTLLDPHVLVKTKYGELKVPTAAIKKVEFANRLSPLVTAQIETAVANLGHADYATREKASATLRDLQEKAYHASLAASKNSNPEIAKRASEVVAFLKNKNQEIVTLKAEDIIYYDDCKVIGIINGGLLKVKTAQFGEQELKLTDMRTLRSGFLRDETVVNAVPAPANMMGFQHQFGKESVFSLTGAVPNATGGSGVWGTDIYTLDSNLAAAAVHAGILRPGQVGTVKVRIVASPQQFTASERNGVSSTGYGNYPAGGYEFVR